MKPEDTMTQVMAIITPLVTRGANIAQEVAARVLGNVVAERLHLDGHEEVLEDFQRNPHNDSLVRHLLLQAMNRNAEFRGGFDDAPQATPRERPRSPGSRRIDIGGAGQVQAGDHSDAISGGRAATRGGSYHQGDNITTTIIKGGAGRVAVLATLAILVCGGLTLRGGDALLNPRSGSLGANSTCQQSLHAGERAEQQALAGLAMPKVLGSSGGPLALRRVRCDCAFSPAMTIGAILDKAKGGY